MFRKEIFKRAFWILALVGALNFAANEFYLHWTLWWFDIVLHFLGGISMALFALWLLSGQPGLKSWSRVKILLVAIFGALLAGILWELYELGFGLTFLADGVRYFADTGSDLLMDCVGGIFGFFYAIHLMKKYE